MDTTGYGTYVDEVDDTCLKQKCQQSGTYTIWETQTVIVKQIPSHESKVGYKCPSAPELERNTTAKIDTREYIELTLPPPIITVWQYELAYALAKGYNCFKY